MTLSIIILSFNTRELTLKCIDSIIGQYKKELDESKFEIIVVDNASTDDSVSSIKKQVLSIKNIRLVENKKNEGFSKGNNIGAKGAKGKHLLFLNSDTEILDDGLLKMTNYLDVNEKVGILGAKLTFPNGKVQSSCGKFYNLLNSFFMLFGLEGMVRFIPEKTKPVDWVSGAAFMIRKDLFNKIYGFDENIFMYTEDMELCFRAKKENFGTVFFSGCNISHKEGKSSNRTFAILEIYKGLLYFHRKHKSTFDYFFLKLMLEIKAMIAILVGYLTKNTYLISTYKKTFSL